MLRARKRAMQERCAGTVHTRCRRLTPKSTSPKFDTLPSSYARKSSQRALITASPFPRRSLRIFLSCSSSTSEKFGRGGKTKYLICAMFLSRTGCWTGITRCTSDRSNITGWKGCGKKNERTGHVGCGRNRKEEKSVKTVRGGHVNSLLKGH